MESPGALPSGGLVFQLVCRFHKYWAYSSKSTVRPKMEYCFQDRACSVSSFSYRIISFVYSTIIKSTVMPNIRIPKREERRPPRQCNSQKGKFIADSSQGSCRIQRSGAGSESPEPKLLYKFIG